MPSVLMDWLDALWILVMLLLLHKNQKLWAAGFVASNMLMMRMLIELMGWMGFTNGFLPVLNNSLFDRGLITYSAVNFLYLVIALYSPKSESPMFLSMSIGLFFGASMLFGIVMLL